MKDQKKLENKILTLDEAGESGSSQPASQKLVRIKMKPGRSVAEAGPGQEVRVTEKRAQYLKVIGFADILED